MTYYSRADWGARSARGGPGNLSPAAVEGIALHWPAMSSPLRGVEAVKAALRGWQAFHMDTRGYSDIAYNEAVDQAGHVYELRGLARTSGANGDTSTNARFGALLLVLAPGEMPTPEMVAAVRFRIEAHRRLFPGSRRIVGHSDIRPEPTACPGPAVTALVRAGAFEPVVTPEPPAAPTKVQRARDLLRAARNAAKKGSERRRKLNDLIRHPSWPSK